MLNTKHTPGPWHTGGVNLISVYGCDGIQLAVITDRDGATPADKANAKLIAAAPDLLEACTRAMNIIEAEHEACSMYTAHIDIIEAAINKATQ